MLLMGIDDTDDASSRGTGYQARNLGKLLREKQIADVHAITRHQLLVDSRIEYTSRNSSACLMLEPSSDDVDLVLEVARSEITSSCAPGSNAGLSLAERAVVDEAIQAYGLAAKREVLSAASATELAQTRAIHLEGLNGSGAGIIGAIAAIGLHAFGNDGRFVWLPGLRKLDGSHTVAEYAELLNVQIATITGDTLPPMAELEVVDWMRPILREGRAILLAERENQDGEISWRFSDKPTVKAVSD